MKKINKCNYIDCNNKLKITALKCKCDNLYCNLHRLPELHECKYIDVEQDKKRKKTIDNMRCISKKIDKI